jgi:hypothetical protein
MRLGRLSTRTKLPRIATPWTTTDRAAAPAGAPLPFPPCLCPTSSKGRKRGPSQTFAFPFGTPPRLLTSQDDRLTSYAKLALADFVVVDNAEELAPERSGCPNRAKRAVQPYRNGGRNVRVAHHKRHGAAPGYEQASRVKRALSH